MVGEGVAALKPLQIAQALEPLYLAAALRDWHPCPPPRTWVPGPPPPTPMRSCYSRQEEADTRGEADGALHKRRPPSRAAAPGLETGRAHK